MCYLLPMTTDAIEAFKEAVQKIGGQSATERGLRSRGIETTQTTIWRKLVNQEQCPEEWIVPVEDLSGVSRHRLRPDLSKIFSETDRGSRDTQ